MKEDLAVDRELERMQEQADCFSHVCLRRIKCSPPPQTKRNDDSTLVLGLILILLIDGGDMLTVLMLLYILGT